MKGLNPSIHPRRRPRSSKWSVQRAVTSASFRSYIIFLDLHSTGTGAAAREWSSNRENKPALEACDEDVELITNGGMQGASVGVGLREYLRRLRRRWCKRRVLLPSVVRADGTTSVGGGPTTLWWFGGPDVTNVVVEEVGCLLLYSDCSDFSMSPRSISMVQSDFCRRKGMLKLPQSRRSSWPP